MPGFWTWSVDESVSRALAEREAVDGSGRQAVHTAFRKAVDSAVCPAIRAAVRSTRAGPIHAPIHMAAAGGTGGREAAGPQARDGGLEGAALRPLEPVRPFETSSGLVGTAESVEDLTFRPPGHNPGRVRAEQGVVVAERLDETRVDGLRRRGCGRLPPASGESRRIGGGTKGVLGPHAKTPVFRPGYGRGLCERVRGLR